MQNNKIIFMFHHISKVPKSKYDVSWKKFKLIKKDIRSDLFRIVKNK